jgi:hypothetical protein
VFAWTLFAGASRYRLEITVPNGWVMKVEMDKTSQTRDMGTLPSRGEYTWRVAALDANGELMCASAPSVFNKKSLRPTSTGVPEVELPSPPEGGG